METSRFSGKCKNYYRSSPKNTGRSCDSQDGLSSKAQTKGLLPGPQIQEHPQPTPPPPTVAKVQKEAPSLSGDPSPPPDSNTVAITGKSSSEPPLERPGALLHKKGGPLRVLY
jgi:hypothetical protein